MRTGVAFALAVLGLLLFVGRAMAVCQQGFTGKEPNCKACAFGTTTAGPGDNLPCNQCEMGFAGKYPKCKACSGSFAMATIKLKDGTNKCVCGQGLTGKYPKCSFCPNGLSTTNFDDGQKCRCIQDQGEYYQAAFPCAKCGGSQGWYKPLLQGFWPKALKSPARSVCVRCKGDGAVVKSVKGVNYCACDSSQQYGYWGSRSGLANQAGLCVKCSGSNTVIDAKGRCKCKPGYGVSNNLFGGDNYCMPCGGKSGTVDANGFCVCKKGYAFDAGGIRCIPCSSVGFTQNKDGFCECKKGYYGGTLVSPVSQPSCKRCAAGQSSEILGGNPLAVCYCKDKGAGVIRGAPYEKGCVCRWGFKLKKGSKAACVFDGFCHGGKYTIEFWSGKSLPKGWNKAAFPLSVLSKKPTATKTVAAGKTLKWVGTTASLPKGVDRNLYVARIRRCTCVLHQDVASRFKLVLAVKGSAGAWVEIDGGGNSTNRCAGDYYDQNACLRPLMDPVYPVKGTASTKGTTVTFPQYTERPGSWLSGMDYILTATNYKACHNVTVLFWNTAAGGQVEVKLPATTLN